VAHVVLLAHAREHEDLVVIESPYRNAKIINGIQEMIAPVAGTPRSLLSRDPTGR
jgi:16S rRNA C1402 (ribose-2'-O) methylase RsmI